LWPERQNRFVEAEHLVALEAALAELGALYTAARNFVALEDRADHELLPQLTRLSARLRTLHRSGGIGQVEIDEVSREILELRSSWQSKLEEIRASDLFSDACRAFERDDQKTLARVVPRIFAGLVRTAAPPRARFGVSAEIRRRGPGTSPFLTAEACAAKLEKIVLEGVAPAVHATEWWLTALPSIHFVADSADLDTPFAVRLPGNQITATVFASDTEIGYRVFTPRQHGIFVVEIANQIDDEWWQAFEQPFEQFRAELQRHLAAKGIAHAVVDL
jgi:hypothetical protein